ncbi:hypothetical protein V6N13_115457 [Hibiscus sabdariffa]
MDSSLSLSPSFNKDFREFDGDKVSYDFGFKLRLNEDGAEEEDEEFSFVSVNADGSTVSADDVFQNGQIRPVFPLFNQDLLFADEDGSVSRSEDGDVSPRASPTKVFVKDSLEPVGPYCEWKRDDGITVEATSPDRCKKSNSTGFSKLRRVRDLMLRSNSDGKDAFVLLNHPFPFSVSAAKMEKKNGKEEKKTKVKGVGEKPPNGKKEKSEKTAASAHEKLYVRNRAIREGDKRRSYLPIRQISSLLISVTWISLSKSPKGTEMAESKPLRKPVFTKVDQLRPGTSGHTLTVKVVSTKMVLQKGRADGPQVRQLRIAECLVGDETGMIIFTARNDQVDLMKEGATVTFRNAKIDMFKGSMRLAVDKWGRIEAAEPASFSVKEDNNLSLIEYELVNVVEE